jgi:hypothetical protein
VVASPVASTSNWALDCPEHKITSPTTTSVRVTVGDTGEDTVRMPGVVLAGDAGRVTLNVPSAPTTPSDLTPLKVTATDWAATPTQKPRVTAHNSTHSTQTQDAKHGGGWWCAGGSTLPSCSFCLTLLKCAETRLHTCRVVLHACDQDGHVCTQNHGAGKEVWQGDGGGGGGGQGSQHRYYYPQLHLNQSPGLAAISCVFYCKKTNPLCVCV